MINTWDDNATINEELFLTPARRQTSQQLTQGLIKTDFIKPYEGVVIFKSGGNEPIPVVVIHGEHYVGIEGYEQVLGALDRKEEYINCIVIRCEYDMDIASFCSVVKLAYRLQPRGGKVLFVEWVYNIAKTAKMYENSRKTEIFSLGGARKGLAYQDIKNNDFIEILIELFGFDSEQREYLVKIMAYGRYLNDETLELLLEIKPPQIYFDVVQKFKIWINNDLIQKNKTDEEISTCVSNMIKESLEIWTKDSDNNVDTKALLLKEFFNKATEHVPDEIKSKRSKAKTNPINITIKISSTNTLLELKDAIDQKSKMDHNNFSKEIYSVQIESCFEKVFDDFIAKIIELKNEVINRKEKQI